MCVTSNKGVNYEKFIEHFQGKTRKFERLSFVLAVFVFLGSVFCCFCIEVAMRVCSKEDEVDSFVVGIRYNLGDNEAVNVPVWSVGGVNTSSLGIRKASLLNNGNLVLVGIEDNVLWQSFNSPTSTLLPGQSLHFPQTLRAPSKKSTSSYYSFVIRHSGELALVWENNVTYWSNSCEPCWEC
ncbi:G-type lectin S-receptor serine/threonine-protein kinase [Populus alba x Populus x berolinensis]|nr:G-type lectin S-receptor serine/threonine-protein kinase [Populus alba x Populus x berolinensis]